MSTGHLRPIFTNHCVLAILPHLKEGTQVAMLSHRDCALRQEITCNIEIHHQFDKG